MKNKRYSNYVDPEYYLNYQIPRPGGVSDSGLIPEGSGTGSGSGWTPQNTVDVVSSGASALTTILTAIFGRNNIQQANYTNELYKQEQRTNTILWVVLGLVLALGVVLVIRKTK